MPIAEAQTIPTTIAVQPGDDGSIEYDLENAPDSEGSLDGVQLILSQDDRFTLQGGSGLIPVSIPPGTNQQMVVNYSIPHDAPDGILSIVVYATATTEDIDPALDTLVSTVDFIPREAPFLVGAQLRAVCQGEAFDGLKFREERHTANL